VEGAEGEFSRVGVAYALPGGAAAAAMAVGGRWSRG